MWKVRLRKCGIFLPVEEHWLSTRHSVSTFILCSFNLLYERGIFKLTFKNAHLYNQLVVQLQPYHLGHCCLARWATAFEKLKLWEAYIVSFFPMRFYVCLLFLSLNVLGVFWYCRRSYVMSLCKFMMGPVEVDICQKGVTMRCEVRFLSNYGSLQRLWRVELTAPEMLHKSSETVFDLNDVSLFQWEINPQLPPDYTFLNVEYCCWISRVVASRPRWRSAGGCFPPGKVFFTLRS